MQRLSVLAGWFAHPLHAFAALLWLVPLARLLLFVGVYGWQMPYGDHWVVGSNTAIPTFDGKLTLTVLARPFNDHRLFFTHVMTALLTPLTGWDARVEVAINLLLVLLLFVVLLWLLRQTRPALLAAALVPFSALMFTLMRETNWYSGLHTQWNFAPLFCLLALGALHRFGVNWRTLAAAAALSLCASYSMASGVLAWGLVLALLILNGHRQWRHYLFWILMTVIGVGLYAFGGGSVFVGATGEDSFVQNSAAFEPLLSLEILLAYLGRLFADRQMSVNIMMTAGAAGLVMVALNLAYLLWRREGRGWLPLWLVVGGYGLGSGVMIALGRVAVGVIVVLSEQYIAAALYFWITYVVVLLAVLGLGTRERLRWFHTALLYLNLAVVVALAVLYFQAENVMLQRLSERWGRSFDPALIGTIRPEEQCVLDYRFTRDVSCASEIRALPDLVDALAARRLTVFAHEPTRFILPGIYQPGSPIGIETGDPWLSVHIRDWLLAGVPNEQVWFVTDAAAQVADSPQPPVNVIASAADFASDAAQVWYLQTDALPTTTLAALENDGYISVYRHRLSEPLPLTLTAYQRLPEAPRLLFRLGDDIALQGWQLLDSVQVAQCQSVTVQTLWSVERSVDFDYSMTLTLTNRDGIGITRADGAPAGLEMNQWLPDQLYLDRRTLTVPCDLPPGEYPLLTGLYDYRDDRSVAVTTADGAPIPGLIYLTTLFVE